MNAGMCSRDTRAMVRISQEKRSSASKTGAKDNEYFSGKKVARRKHTALTSANVDVKEKDTEFLITKKVVSGELRPL